MLGDCGAGAGAGVGVGVGAGAGVGVGAGGAGLVALPSAGLGAPLLLAGLLDGPGKVGIVRLCFCVPGMTSGPF